MSRTSRVVPLLIAVALTSVLMGSGLSGAAPVPKWRGVKKKWLTEVADRSVVPGTRYDMAGGCYAVKAVAGGYLIRSGSGFAATASSADQAEPFFFQATDLGSYLLYGAQEDFLAASEGALGQAVYGVTETDQGQVVGGVTMEQTDAAADEVARSDANRQAGRGESVVAAEAPSELADWVIEQDGTGSFSLSLPATEQALAVGSGGALQLVAPNSKGSFAFELIGGCAQYPEIEVNVDGPLIGGPTSFGEVRGFMDLHLHGMAFEFLGGRARCGRPWHRYGVTHALVDCPDHEPGGYGSVLESVLTNKPGGHSTDGWPTFEGWPTWITYTHEQIYYKWLERAWRGGMRMFTNLLVDNNQLCKLYPFKRNSCNEMDGVRLQHQRIYELQDYIDAQYGGPGKGWFRIVTDPYQAREVINQGKLAVVLGIEVSVPLDCGLTLDQPRCNTQQLVERLDAVYDMGVRQMELVNKFDNALSGVTGDGGSTGVIVNNGNKNETGFYWKMDTCVDPEGDAHEHGGHVHLGDMHDKTQYNFHDQSGFPDEITGRDALAGGILATTGTSGAAPIYPQGPHCNQLGLSDLGRTMITEMVRRGMIFDPDHMSAKGRLAAMDLIDSLAAQGYEMESGQLNNQPAVVSSHGWADDIVYPRVYETGGVVTPHAGTPASFVEKWRKHKLWGDDRFFFGFGTGADTNGFSQQGGPRNPGEDNDVDYPFAGFGGVTIDQQHSGTRAYDFNTDGFAHFGMYPDWMEDLRILGGDEIIEDMTRGPEAYLQMWERAIGIAPDSCRTDVADLSDGDLAALRSGMSPREVLETVGQPHTRIGDWTYCVTGDRGASVRFTPSGTLASWSITA